MITNRNYQYYSYYIRTWTFRFNRIGGLTRDAAETADGAGMGQ